MTTSGEVCPEVIITDPGSGFASEVMACVYRILGVKERQVKERGAKGPVSVVEAKHRLLNIVLSDGFASGSIKDARGLSAKLLAAFSPWQFLPVRLH